jgi:signal transduction histidine kinase/DNA-binding response OmpR family regulator
VMFILTDPQPIKVEARISMLNQVGEMMALAIVREQVNEMLEKSRDAALQAAAIKSEFLANMSHEIRTPMNGVLGMLDLLKDTELSREQWDLVETAANSAEALLDIINDILDFSKLEAGKVELEIIEFNLPALIEEVCSLMAARVHAKDLELNCFIPVDMPKRWHGDPTRIRQVLINLVGNAVKFTEQGEISVKILQIKTDNGESAIRIEINDTGVGIPVEAQAHLFQPFAQADTSTARRFGGTGLGLSISSDLIKLMGGKIGLESALGQGALFWLNLPLKPAPNEALPLITDLAGLRVLIVDDNATNRQILEHYLKHWGFIFEESDNAMDALKKLEEAAKDNAAFNLLISDLHMPEMDGYALMRAINKNPNIADTPRILLSSGGLCTEEERKLLNISQSLLKPARQAQLFDAILNTLQSATIAPTSSTRKNPLLTSYQGKQVLVVEDHKVNQKVILSLLTKFGLTPSLAENGQKALEAMANQHFDLVLMDCQMPVMDGYEATRLLREKEKASNTLHTPVIALTAHAGDGQYEKCISAGMDDYISKPIERSKLAEVLSQWLDGSSGEIAEDNADKIIESKPDTGWDELGALEKLDNDEELLAELIELFIAEIPTQVSELKKAQAQGDLPSLADSAHAIKGMAGHFCATAIISLAAELEDAARLSKAVDFKVLSDCLADQVTNLINLLQQK